MSSRELDLTDRKILKLLAEDGKLSNAQLAEKIGLSPSPCWQRVKRLEAEGFITGYAALLDQEKLGLGEMAIIQLTLDTHNQGSMAELGAQLAAIPEVLEAYLTAGDCDYIIKVAVSSTKGYEAFLRDKLYQIPGIRHSKTNFVLRCHKDVQAVVPE